MKSDNVRAILFLLALLAVFIPKTGLCKIIEAADIDAVKDAISVAEKGDTIFLKEGLYRFEKEMPGLAIISKTDITLKGQGWVVLQGVGQAGPLLSIRQSNGIRIENLAFSLQRSRGKSFNAFQIENSLKIQISDCLLHTPKGKPFYFKNAADVRVQDCIVYDSLSGLVASYFSRDLDFIHNLVWKNSGGEMIYGSKSWNVRFADNLFAYNKMSFESIQSGFYNITRTMTFASFSQSSDIQFHQNYFSENGFERVARVRKQGGEETVLKIPVQFVDSLALNGKEDSWPDKKFISMARRLDLYKKEFTRPEKNLKKSRAKSNFTVNSPKTGNKTTILHPGDDINRAIKDAIPGETIILSPGTYAYYTSDTPVDIEGKENLTILSEGKAYVLCTNPNVTPLVIRDSKDIRIEKIHFGHAIKKGNCFGRVSIIEKSSHVTLSNCTLHGSGIVAVESDHSQNILVEGCALVQCTESVLRAWSTSNLLMKNNFIAENDNSWPASWGGKNAIFTSNRASNLQVRGNLIYKNQTEFVSFWEKQGFFFAGNVFANNSFSIPAKILKDKSNQSYRLPENIDINTMMMRRDIWPDAQVKQAAKDYLNFLNVLKEFERTEKELL